MSALDLPWSVAETVATESRNNGFLNDKSFSSLAHLKSRYNGSFLNFPFSVGERAVVWFQSKSLVVLSHCSCPSVKTIRNLSSEPLLIFSHSPISICTHSD